MSVTARVFILESMSAMALVFILERLCQGVYFGKYVGYRRGMLVKPMVFIVERLCRSLPGYMFWKVYRLGPGYLFWGDFVGYCQGIYFGKYVN